MSQPYVPGNIAGYLAGAIWQQTYVYAHASGRVKYICRNFAIDAPLAEGSWYVWKFDDAALPRWEGPRIASDGIAAEATVDLLAWGF